MAAIIPDRVVPCIPLGPEALGTTAGPTVSVPSSSQSGLPETIPIAFHQNDLNKLRQSGASTSGDATGKRWVLVTFLVDAAEIERAYRGEPDLQPRSASSASPNGDGPYASPGGTPQDDTELLTISVRLRRPPLGAGLVTQLTNAT
jgi:hypothetical protein